MFVEITLIDENDSLNFFRIQTYEFSFANIPFTFYLPMLLHHFLGPVADFLPQKGGLQHLDVIDAVVHDPLYQLCTVADLHGDV